MGWVNEDMTRSRLCKVLQIGLLCGVATAALAQGASRARMSAAVAAHGSYEVQITPSTMKDGSTEIAIGEDEWSARGYDLKSLIAQIYDVDVRRIEVANAQITNAKYDVSLALPQDESQEGIQRRLRDALQKKFGVSIKPETRSMEVYALTAPNGMGPALHRHGSSMRGNGLMKQVSLDRSNVELDDAQQISYMGKECSGVASGGITATAASLSEFSKTLEPDLDRVLVDDTRLAGSYDFQIGRYSNQQELFQKLHEQLGLVVVPTTRNVVVLTVHAN